MIIGMCDQMVHHSSFILEMDRIYSQSFLEIPCFPYELAGFSYFLIFFRERSCDISKRCLFDVTPKHRFTNNVRYGPVFPESLYSEEIWGAIFKFFCYGFNAHAGFIRLSLIHISEAHETRHDL